MNLHIAEIWRRLNGLLLIGEIDSYDGTRAVVKAGEIKTAPLPWLAHATPNRTTWSPYPAGTQVMVICPHGDTAQGVILGSLYHDETEPDEQGAGVEALEWSDGGFAKYDHENGTATLSATSSVVIDTPELLLGADDADDPVMRKSDGQKIVDSVNSAILQIHNALTSANGGDFFAYTIPQSPEADDATGSDVVSSK